MAKSFSKKLLSQLRGIRKFVTSKRVIPVIKGTIAYILGLALIFTRKFEDLSHYPLALSSMIIVILSSGAGRTIGSCVQATALSMAGVLVGTAFFAILAKLAHVPVAQGVVFAAFVYSMSLIKTRGQRWFSFALLSILMAFNGIYTSFLLNGVFSPTYLVEYLKAYTWGAAISLSVNLLILPRTSERELRKTIATSLEHIATFAALIGKAYALKGTEEDMEDRELLSNTIKADYTFLTQIIEETSIEINWSKFSMQDYQRFTDRIRMLQRSLITAHISLQRLNEKDVEIFRDYILPPTKLAFTKLRRDIDFTIQEIGASLGCGPMFIEATQSGYLECLDQQRAASDAAKPQTLRHSSSGRTVLEKDHKNAHTRNRKHSFNEGNDEKEETMDVQANLINVAKRLQQELGAETPARSEYTRPSTPTNHAPHSPHSPHSPVAISVTPGGTTAVATPHATKSHSSPVLPKLSLPLASLSTNTKHSSEPKYGPAKMKAHFEEFETAQKDVFILLLTTSEEFQEAELKVHKPGPSISELYGGDYLRGDFEQGDLPDKQSSKKRVQISPSSKPKLKTMSEVEEGGEGVADGRVEEGPHGGEHDHTEDSDGDEFTEPTPQFKRNETLVRVYSLLHAWDNFVETLATFHAECQAEKKPRLHFHIYEFLVRPGKKAMPDNGMEDTEELQEEARELPIREALALLENKPYTPVKVTLVRRINDFNKWLSSEKSIFAAKSAAAASVFATLIFANTTRQWFINYTLTSGLLTCIVALAPTLGQSLRTFIFQICGSGLGTLLGWTILEMFKNVHGYAYYPYGLWSVMIVFALPLQYCIYERPQLFILAFLALNSAGTIMTLEVINTDYYHNQYDSPALRAGKAMTSLAVALAIVITFQLFVLRNPARRTLRKELGKLVYANLAYNTILQAYVRCVLPANPAHRVKPAILKRIERELKYREAKMQAQIIGISPLMAYASVEPSLSYPFRGDILSTIVQANQIILDRLREARGAIGAEPFDPYILENMVAVLSPYRRRATRMTKTGLYLCATSLMSKSPLPHDSIFAQQLLNHLIHDALVLSSRLIKTEEGARAVRSDSFTRYWFYIISVGGIQIQIKQIETACKKLYGELEEDPRIS